MTDKMFCDVCGKEIPDSRIVSHNGATKMFQGRFMYGAVVVDESDDLCQDCGKLVRDYIRELKKARAEKK